MPLLKYSFFKFRNKAQNCNYPYEVKKWQYTDHTLNAKMIGLYYCRMEIDKRLLPQNKSTANCWWRG